MSVGSVLGGIKDAGGSVLSTINAPFTVINAGSRTAVDVVPNAGFIGDRWNWRDSHRKSGDRQRFGEGLGGAAAVAIPTVSLGRWGMRSIQSRTLASTPAISRLSNTPGRLIGSGVLIAGASYMGYKGYTRVRDMVSDDGNFSAAGAALGMTGAFVGGYKIGTRIKFGGGRLAAFNPVIAPLTGGAAAIAGGILGHSLGKGRTVGDGKPKIDPYVSTFKPATTQPGMAIDFGRAAAIDLWDVGPPSQGISFRHKYNGDEIYASGYSQVEEGGALAGDLAGAAIMGGGALAVTRGLTHGGVGQQRFGHFAAITGNLNMGKKAADMVSFLPAYFTRNGVGSRGVTAGMYTMAGVGLTAAGAFAIRDWQRADTGTDKALIGAGVGAGVLATGAAYRGNFVKGVVEGAHISSSSKAATAALTGAVLIGVLSSARLPVQQFISNSRQSWSEHPGERKNIVPAAIATGLGGTAIGFNVAGRFSSKLSGGKRGLVVGIGSLIGAGIGAAAGLGIAPNIANPVNVGASAGVGALAIGTAAFFLGGKNAKTALLAAGIGAGVGAMTSPMLGGHKVVAPPPVTDPTEAPATQAPGAEPVPGA